MINKPSKVINTLEVFGTKCNFEVLGFDQPTEHVPEIDSSYRFDPETTIAILAGFANNRRVLVQGYHGTGKSTHIEQVAARLNWPCVRVNLDSHISRIDLIGKDAIVLNEGKQVTEFQDGIVDKMIEIDAGKTIKKIFEEDGEVYFRDLEEKITLDTLSKNNIVVALGGGAFTNKNIRKEILKNLEWIQILKQRKQLNVPQL